MELVDITDEAPWGVKSNLTNWIVKCPHFTSVWSGIHAMLDCRELERIQ